MPDHHRDAAQRIQEKFYFYLVGLAFTILGLSIQTSKLGQFILSDVIELAGWLCLLVSGIIGLMRLEWEPYLHEKIAAVNLLDKDRKDVKNSLDNVQSWQNIDELTGVVDDLQKEMKEVTEKIDAINRRIEEDSQKSIKRYRIQKFTFFAGIVFLVLSRGTLPYKDAILCFYQSICR